jgi:transcriptional regulator with XRE-family HTH domain
MTLGQKIRELREEKGYSLRELAKLAGSASHSYIAAVERGEYDPSLKIVRDIARALNVPTAYLLDIYDQDHSGYKKFKIKESQVKYNSSNMIKVPILAEGKRKVKGLKGKKMLKPGLLKSKWKWKLALRLILIIIPLQNLQKNF